MNTTPITLDSLSPLPEQRCPLCGKPNDCAVACSNSFDQPCWCTSVQFSADTLARIPEQQRGKACVCRSCAEGKDRP
ncbi:MAG: cysteine-rich CWC family protein [Burkholderiales bacterium]